MRVAVLGGGVVGVVTAWYLTQNGHDVTLFDRAQEVASGSSYANAGQLSYSFTDAFACPSFLRKLPALLLNRDPGTAFHAKAAPEIWHWGSAFVRECTASRARNNTVAVLQLAMRSATLLEQLMDEVPLEFSFARAGKLVLLPAGGQLEAAARSVALKKQHGCSTELLQREAVLQLEPALRHWRDKFVAAVWSSQDQVADARMFSISLAEHLKAERGVVFRLDERVNGLGFRHQRIGWVRTDSGDAATDAVVVCLGVESGRFLRPLGIRLPIFSLRGYSLTLPVAEESPKVSVSHAGHKIVLSRLGQKVRIAGFADIAAADRQHDQRRLDALLALARRLAPLAADYAAVDKEPWAGNRPMTPNGQPRVGSTAIPGLFLNTGHGMLGWTLACATAQEVARSVS